MLLISLIFTNPLSKNYLLLNIPQNQPKIYKTPQNIELCNKHRVSGLLKVNEAMVSDGKTTLYPAFRLVNKRQS